MNDPFSASLHSSRLLNHSHVKCAALRRKSSVEFLVSSSLDTVVLVPGLHGGIFFGAASSFYLDLSDLAPMVKYHDQIDAVDRYSIVSHGSRVFFCGSELSNKGWFEASRVSLVDNLVSLHQLVGSTSYVTGAIEDLDKYLFENLYVGKPNFVFSSKPVYSDMDAIVIKFNSCIGLKFFIQSVSNQEIIFDEDSFMSRFNTISPDSIHLPHAPSWKSPLAGVQIH